MEPMKKKINCFNANMLWKGTALLLCSCIFVVLICNIPLRVKVDVNEVNYVQKVPVKVIDVTATPAPTQVATIPWPNLDRFANHEVSCKLIATVTPTFSPTLITVQSSDEEHSFLSPIWWNGVSQWSREIDRVHQKYGLDPDLIASIVFLESSGNAQAISSAGAVGLMGVMSRDTGFKRRPNQKQLLDPTTNLTWGCSIFAEIMRQAGGDLHSALAAYNGGWEYVNYSEPQQYATTILDLYGRAVAKRVGVDPDEAQRWTVAIELPKGELSAESLHFGEKVMRNVLLYGEHVVYQAMGEDGRPYYIKGYAVPIEMKTTPESEP